MSAHAQITWECFSEKNYPEYEEKSECSAPSLSFYASIGLGMLEIIVRERACEKFKFGLTNLIEGTLHQAATLIHDKNIDEIMVVFTNLLSVMNTKDHSRKILMDWLKFYLFSDLYNATDATILAMKAIIYTILEDNIELKEKIFGVSSLTFNDYEILIQALCTKMPLSFKLLRETEVKMFLRPQSGEWPLLVLYQDLRQEKFNLLYHKDIKSFDISEELTFNICRPPFTYQSEESKQVFPLDINPTKMRIQNRSELNQDARNSKKQSTEILPIEDQKKEDLKIYSQKPSIPMPPQMENIAERHHTSNSHIIVRQDLNQSKDLSSHNMLNDQNYIPDKLIIMTPNNTLNEQKNPGINNLQKKPGMPNPIKNQSIPSNDREMAKEYSGLADHNLQKKPGIPNSIDNPPIPSNGPEIAKAISDVFDFNLQKKPGMPTPFKKSSIPLNGAENQCLPDPNQQKKFGMLNPLCSPNIQSISNVIDNPGLSHHDLQKKPDMPNSLKSSNIRSVSPDKAKAGIPDSNLQRKPGMPNPSNNQNIISSSPDISKVNQVLSDPNLQKRPGMPNPSNIQNIISSSPKVNQVLSDPNLPKKPGMPNPLNNSSIPSNDQNIVKAHPGLPASNRQKKPGMPNPSNNISMSNDPNISKANAHLPDPNLKKEHDIPKSFSGRGMPAPNLPNNSGMSNLIIVPGMHSPNLNSGMLNEDHLKNPGILGDNLSRNLGMPGMNLSASSPSRDNLSKLISCLPPNPSIASSNNSASTNLRPPHTSTPALKYDLNLLEIIKAFSYIIINEKIQSTSLMTTLATAIANDPGIENIEGISAILSMKNVLFKVEKPPKNLKICCKCKKSQDEESFTAMSCPGRACTVCTLCRVSLSERQCPECNRLYENYDLELHGILRESLNL